MNKTMKIFLSILAFTPIVFDKSVPSSFGAPKSLFVFSLVFIISLLFVINFFTNNDFRESVVNKIRSYHKNPIVLSIFTFIVTVLLSTIFAVDKYRAFWGDVERSEGLVGIVFLSSVFFFTLLIFEKRDWLWFFRLSLITSLILVIKALAQYGDGMVRPESFLGNPAFMAGYLIFPIFFSLYIFFEDKNTFWKYFSVVSIIFSVLGIFLSQTRSTILGLAVGLVFVLIYGIWKGKNTKVFKINIRKLSVVLFSLVIVFGAIFISTRDSLLWQKVPGLGRVAQISDTDSTTQTRLLLAKISLASINPGDNGWKKTLIGWGQDNYTLAYLKNFNPKLFDYELISFDRGHNKLLDTIVMNGAFGLLAYLSIFVFFFIYIFKKKEFSFINASLLLFGVSYLVHLLFIFDQITTYIPMFIIMSYIVYTNSQDKITTDKIDKNKDNFIFSIPFMILTVLFGFVLFTSTIPGYLQMRRFTYLFKSGNTQSIIENSDRLFNPFTVPQMDIRRAFIQALQRKYDVNDTNINKLVSIGFDKEEEYLNKEPWDLKSKAILATVYVNIGKKSNNQEFVKKGEQYFRELLAYSPNRPDYNYGLALALFVDKKFDESFFYFEKSFGIAPNLYFKEKESIEKIYVYFFKYFYKQKDKDDLIKVSNILIKNNYPDSDNLNKIVNFLEKNNVWPNISFE